MDSVLANPICSDLSATPKPALLALPQSLTDVCFVVAVQPLSRVRLCDPVDRSTPGLPVHHQLPQSKVPFPFSALGSRGSPGTHQAVRHKLGPLLLTEPCQREGSALRSQEMRPITVRGGRLETSPGPCTCSAVVPLSPLPSFPLLLHSSLRLSLLAPGSLLFLILFPSPSSFSLSRFHSFCTHSLSTYYVPGPL